MIRIPVEASRNYEVLIERGLLDRAGTEVRAATRAGSAVLVAGENVWPLYGARRDRGQVDPLQAQRRREGSLREHGQL